MLTQSGYAGKNDAVYQVNQKYIDYFLKKFDNSGNYVHYLDVAQDLKNAREKEAEEERKKAREKEAQLKDEQDTQLKDEQDTQLQDEQEIQLQDEQDTQLKDEQEIQLQDEQDTQLQDEQEIQFTHDQNTAHFSDWDNQHGAVSFLIRSYIEQTQGPKAADLEKINRPKVLEKLNRPPARVSTALKGLKMLHNYIPPKSKITVQKALLLENMEKKLLSGKQLVRVDRPKRMAHLMLHAPEESSVLCNVDNDGRVSLWQRRQAISRDTEPLLLNNLQAPENVFSLKEICEFLESYVRKDLSAMQLLERPLSLIPRYQPSLEKMDFFYHNYELSEKLRLYYRMIYVLANPSMKELIKNQNLHEVFQVFQGDPGTYWMRINGKIIRCDVHDPEILPKFAAAAENFPKRAEVNVVKYVDLGLLNLKKQAQPKPVIS